VHARVQMWERDRNGCLPERPTESPRVVKRARDLKFVAIPVLLVVGVAVYLVFAHRAKRAPTQIGPEGRWWGVKLLIAMAITVAVLLAVIAGYVQYVNGTR
jgi:hypothetical protein